MPRQPTTTAATTDASSLKSIKIQVACNDVRRFPFPIDTNQCDQFQALIEALGASVPSINKHSVTLQYIDEDSDTISVNSHIELACAVASQPSPLRLTVVVRASAIAAPTSADETQPLIDQQQQQQQAPAAAPQCDAKRGRANANRPCNAKQARAAVEDDETLMQRYREQLQALRSEGLNSGRWAARVLASVSGDLEQAKTVIRQRLDQQNAALRTKHASHLDQLAAKQLIDVDNAEEVGRAVRLLERFNGNIEQVAGVLQKQCNARKARMDADALKARFADKLQQLEARGFIAKPVCIRLLRKFDGNVDKVAQRMSKLNQTQQATTKPEPEPTASTASEPAPTTTEPEPEPTTKPNANKSIKAAREAALQAHVSQLVARGYDRELSERWLKRLQGNMQACEHALEFRKRWDQQADQRAKKLEMQTVQSRFATEMQQLNEMGFSNKWLTLPLLLLHNGDVASVALTLTRQ
jgi:transposase-like protein